MALSSTLELADHGPVIPVIVLQRTADAVPLARALVAGGVRVLEVTLRTRRITSSAISGVACASMTITLSSPTITPVLGSPSAVNA